MKKKTFLPLILLLSIFSTKILAEDFNKSDFTKNQTYWYGYSWGLISQTCLLYMNGHIDLKTGQINLLASLKVLDLFAPSYLERVTNDMLGPEFKKCRLLVD